MLRELEREYRVGWIEAIGTDPRYPVSEGWPHLQEQLIGTLEKEYRGEPVVGVGHSLGGFLTFIAAARRPELFRAIVLLDAPVLGPLRGNVLAALKRLGLVDRVTPAPLSRVRRSRWPGREEARAHFRGRGLFARFAEECLDDYVRHGLVEDAEGGLRLLIDPAIEAKIYNTIPHGMRRHLPQLRVPAGFIGGTRSDVVRRAGVGAMRGRFALREIAGGHLFPFEDPRGAGQAVLRLVAELRSPGGPSSGAPRAS